MKVYSEIRFLSLFSLHYVSNPNELLSSVEHKRNIFFFFFNILAGARLLCYVKICSADVQLIETGTHRVSQVHEEFVKT